MSQNDHEPRAAATIPVLSGQSGSTAPVPSRANDLSILNYALTLELLEAAVYTQGRARFSSAHFAAANFYPYASDGLRNWR